MVVRGTGDERVGDEKECRAPKGDFAVRLFTCQNAKEVGTGEHKMN